MSFNRSRSLFQCEPNCPRRKPGCQDRCKRYRDAKTLHEARKKEYYGDPDLLQYLAAKSEKTKDAYVKHQKRTHTPKWTKD